MNKNLRQRLICFFEISQRTSLILLIFLFFNACQDEFTNESDIESISVSISFDRFDLKFYDQPSEVIPELKKKYPFLFPKQFSDSVWISRQKDSLQLLLQSEVNKTFKDIELFERDVDHLFKHIKYFFPFAKTPRVITLTNNVDYQIKTVYSDSLLLISLDTFLGSENHLYDGIPTYIRKELDPKYITVQIADKFGAFIIPPVEDRTFLARMIYEGKKLYLNDLLLPHVPIEDRIVYTKEEFNWALENEKYVWQYFIEKQVLYQTQLEWVQRFIEPAPFSKFYLQLDNETPGRIGSWLGWQIVNSYMIQFPETPLDELLKISPQKLFNLSKYKPKR
ncbi:gliding motility lipoprotein GldB [Flavobacteriaceae bacterium]|jgi:gliding motility-associated lipoprotein GldB|nr:gliding motility lipoprotein GldB [Flavobacteriaceae bacterium]MDB4255149.1 gliding motility lipoprotein GldB [Flavobacteriaceae bacterium]